MAAAGTGTPAYLYDLDAIEREARSMVEAFGHERHEVAYAIKANSAASIGGQVDQTPARAAT